MNPLRHQNCINEPIEMKYLNNKQQQKAILKVNNRLLELEKDF